jgi:hypothetical protein
MISIRPVNPEEADELTRIALAAKRHWGYPERWIEIWTPQLTFDAGYFEANESWAADADYQPVAFYTLLDKNGAPGWKTCGSRPSSLAKASAGCCSSMPWSWRVGGDIKSSNSKRIPTRLVSMRKWACTKLVNGIRKWMVGRGVCLSWRWSYEKYRTEEQGVACIRWNPYFE